MKYTIEITMQQIVEAEAETEEQAIEQVKAQLDPRQAASARFDIVTELIYDAATNTYMTEEMANDQSRMDKDEGNSKTSSEDA